MKRPCYFYNTGGCYHHDGSEKTAKECLYEHVLLDFPMERPQHLRRPCRYYHLGGYCRDPFCSFGHNELLPDKWARYFGQEYPGRGYSHNCVWKQYQEDEQIKQTIMKMVKGVLDDYF